MQKLADPTCRSRAALASLAVTRPSPPPEIATEGGPIGPPQAGRARGTGYSLDTWGTRRTKWVFPPGLRGRQRAATGGEPGASQPWLSGGRLE
ncbi:hypothetical protein LZ30DRAFT_339150 [Colletotrichum cereale]|nr:hypothetical protein LZ30DRAFT_339150 [Colletotrichum cereale]